MKTSLALLLTSLLLVFSLTACGSEQKPENGLVPVSLVLDWTPNTNFTGLSAALDFLAEKLGEGKTVVTVLPDTAERYFSTPLFDK